ncbi:uncharacterized protein SCHCODRAFT_02579841 [Schizophyllum commune H4-8]|nr:uncharacterized protein SCHCODRAFT_02579841 [Schizophyllum commune H4-8]KAI5892922.1 hypothetical protein SCHCODRAFT_02579841 [Schizophyllum commune H4-8]
MSTAARSPRSCTPPLRKGWYVEDVDSEEDVQGEPQRSGNASTPRSKRPARSQLRRRKRRRKISSETSSVSTAVRRRVDDALRQIRVLPIEATTPTCAVTLACPDASTLYLEPDTPCSVLDKLAWAWNKDRGSLKVNLDIQKNEHPLNTVISRYLNQTDCSKCSRWLLCPDDPDLLLDMYLRYLDSDILSPPVSNPNVRCDPNELYRESNVVDFKYRLLPLPFTRQSESIHGLAPPVSESAPQAQVSLTGHPFAKAPAIQDLPAIILPIPYHFVIYDTGKKLESIYGATRPTLNRVVEVFHVHIALAAIDDAREGQGGSGEPSGHDESGGQSALDDTYGLCDKSIPSTNDTGLASSSAGGVGHSPLSLSPALRPSDFASCRDVAEGQGENGGDMHACEKGDAQAGVDEEAQECGEGASDEEWEDQEYGEYLKAWAEDVWKATREVSSRAAGLTCAHVEH